MHTFLPATAAAALTLALNNHALAHASLIGAAPAADATVSASPSKLDLSFSEELEIKFSGVSVSGTGNAAVSLGAAMISPSDKTELVVPILTPLAPGRYIVNWHVLLKDGHKTHGSYGFTIAP
jgi:copper resistance protein C